MSAHLIHTEAGLHIHYSATAPELADRELPEPPCAFSVRVFGGEQLLARRAVAACVGPDAAVQVSKIDHAELFYGIHWLWQGEQLFTAAGIQIILDRLAETHGVAALALRAFVRRHMPAPTSGARALRANGYVLENEEAAA